MKRKLFCILAFLMIFSIVLAGAGCGGGKMNMLMGRWKLSTYGSGSGSGQQSYPIPFSIDLYPDGRVELLDEQFGHWTMDRDTFTFKSDDGTINMTGAFRLEYPKLTIYVDNEDTSYVLEKTTDLAPLISMEKAATPSPKVAATPAATATAAPSASK